MATAHPFASEGALAPVVRRNIRELLEVRAHAQRKRTRPQRLADAITAFAGNMISVAFHALLFGGWILVNSGVIPGVRPFDPFPYVMLAMFASVEAIFLSTFVLISQNRQAALSEARADLDLQINLLSEHEITQLIRQVDAICAALGVVAEDPAILDELKQDVSPAAVLEQLESAERAAQTEDAEAR